MKNQTLWQGIASDLENEIVAGSLARGSRLPTETMLSQRYGVNRHTIRKALSHLAEKSLIWSKRGSGVFVMQKPTVYSMGERGRFSQNLLDAGRTPSRQKLSLSQRLATHEEASSLKIKKNSKNIFLKLAKSGIIVRTMDVYKIKNSLRVTIGTSSENRKFIKKLC